MKAAIYTKFGPPNVLHIEEVEKPIPLDNEVLIRIYATTVEKEEPDWRNKPGFNGFRKPKHPILGMFIAGIIEEIGENVEKFQIGDKVYGSLGLNMGGTAEYVSVSEDAAIVNMPSQLSFVEGVSVLNGALTALPFLVEKGDIQKGEKPKHVLINGASGSVGTCAVQIAKYFGAEVTAVCSTGKIDIVKKLGADRVIDYTQEDFTQVSGSYNIIFDTVGNSSLTKCKGILNSTNGIFITTVPDLGTIYQMLIGTRFGKVKVRFMAAGLRKIPKKLKDLHFINEIFKEGKMQATIDHVLPLEDIVKAHEYVAQGHKAGSVVIRID